jgi:hypothetical protein
MMLASVAAATVLASGCAAGETRTTFERIVAAYNAGDTFRFNSVSGGFGHFAYVLERRARDFRAGRKFRLPGKGALSCSLEPKTFVVMSLGGPRPG